MKKNHDKNKEKNKKRPSKKNNNLMKCLDNTNQRYLNMNENLNTNFIEEFYYYMKINLKKFDEKNSLEKLENKDQVFINEIIELFDNK